MSESTSSRLLRLLSLMQGRRSWQGHELAERLAVSGRTVRRDIERLRELGYPVKSVSGPAGGYELASGAAMPPLLLDDEEAIAIAVSLSVAAGGSVTGVPEAALRALAKLQQVLPSHLRRRVQTLQAATSTLLLDPTTPADPQDLMVLAAATRDAECVRFDYTARDGVATRRTVEPHALVTAEGRWYLVAWDPGKAAWRTFRIDRLRGLRPVGTRFPPRVLPAADPAAYVASRRSQREHRFTARITIDAQTLPADHQRWAGAQLHPVEGGRAELRTGDDDLDMLAIRMLMLGVDFQVHDSPELAARLSALGHRIARAVEHHDDATGGQA